MLKKNVTISFDSTHFVVTCEDTLLIDMPAFIVRKKSETPCAISIGKDALLSKDELAENEMLVAPFKTGKILDVLGAKLFIKNVLKTRLKLSPYATVSVLVQSGLSEEETVDLEDVFYASGYKNVQIVQRAELIAELLTCNNKSAGLYFDNDTAEFVVAHPEIGVKSYAINVSFSALAENLRDYFLRTNKLKLSIEVSEHIAKNYCSLFFGDTTKIIAEGKDSITFMQKSVILTAKDIYHITRSIYLKVSNLIKAVVLDLPETVPSHIATKGIVLLGDGKKIQGLHEFIYKELGLGVI